MKKRILLAAILSGVLSSTAFADGTNSQLGMMHKQKQQNMQRGCGMGMMTEQQGMMRYQSPIRVMGGMMGGGMQMFLQLNLTSDQQYQLSILRDEMRLEMKKQLHATQPMKQMITFIKGENFDKEAFKKQMEKQHEKMLNLMADNMEKAFKILTKEQKEQLKANMK